MPAKLPEEIFNELVSLVKQEASSYNMPISVNYDNPYIYLETTQPFPSTRNEVKSVLTSEFTKQQNESYTLSFVDTTKEGSSLTYKLLIKENIDSVFNGENC